MVYYDNGNESTTSKCFSSIIINSLLVNDGLNSTVHTFIFVVIIYYHILYIIIFRNLLITKPYEGIIYYLVRNICCEE